jgi:hypothetical protein
MQVNLNQAGVFRGTPVLLFPDGAAYAYQTANHVVDADGAPQAYSPSDVPVDIGVGLDAPANAGYPSQAWWPDVLVPDPNDPTIAYLQTSEPGAGFFVAQTSLRNPTGNKYNPATYVDATEVPYVVIPTGFRETVGFGGQPGDVGVACHLASGAVSFLIVGDEGGGKNALLGESSIALFGALGYISLNARVAAALPGDVLYVSLWALPIPVREYGHGP